MKKEDLDVDKIELPFKATYKPCDIVKRYHKKTMNNDAKEFGVLLNTSKENKKNECEKRNEAVESQTNGEVF